MAHKVKWITTLLFSVAIAGALSFSARQAFAARRAMDPCPCTMPLSADVCPNTECCDEPTAICGTGFFCVCA